MQWSFMHRGRSGADTIHLRIGAPGAPVQVQSFTTGTTGGMNGWRRYSGVYVVPAGQPQTQLSFVAGPTASGNASIGNFLDDVSFGTGPCIRATSTITRVGGGSTYHATNRAVFSTTISNVGSMLSSNGVVTIPVPQGVDVVDGTITIAGSTRTNAVDGDSASYDAASRTITMRVGTGATSSAGGTIAQGTSFAVSYTGLLQPASAGTTLTHQPTISYTNDLAPTWPLSLQPQAVAVQVQQPSNLIVTGTVTPSTVNKGSATTVRWDFRLRNEGPLAAESPLLTISIPAGLGAGTDPMGGNITCTTPNASGVSTCTPTGALGVDGVRDVYLTRTVPTSAAFQAQYAVTATASAASYDPADDSTLSLAVTVNDTQAPGAVGSLAASGTTRNQTTLTWTAASDNVSVQRYDIQRNNTTVGTSTGTSFTATGLTAGTAYTWRVRAVDQSGNVGAWTSVQMTTRPAAFASAQAVRIQNANGLCLTYSTNTATIQQVTCNTNSTAQRWRLYETATDSGIYAFRAVDNTSLLWAVQSSTTPAADGLQLQLAGSQGTAATGVARAEFDIVLESDGRYSFRPQSSPGSCVDVPNNVATSGTTLQQYTCNNTTAQRFTITAAG
jgi:chitodextrinase